MNRECQMTDCAFAAALWVARVVPQHGGSGNAEFAAKPLGASFHRGVALCVDHAHEALDYMIHCSRPLPTEAEQAERTS